MSTIKNPIQIYFQNDSLIELGIDEAGRGPMLGRVYAAAVILPKNDSFNHFDMKDSKKFTSKKKILEVYNYIKTNALAYSINYSTEQDIDKYNIRKATHFAMHKCIKDLITKMALNKDNIHLLVDGTDFSAFTTLENDILVQPKTTLIKSGDSKYSSIAAASILAKVERDHYIELLCDQNPELDERYKIRSNKGYGAKVHMEGIKKYGISEFHRKTFGICKNY